MPKPDVELPLLVGALADMGITAAVWTWQEPFEWGSVPLVVIRSPWDYVEHLPEFLEWAKSVDAVTRLLNPLEVVTWNARKDYLLDLERKGVPIVPTTIAHQYYGMKWPDLSVFALDEILVAKPIVGVGALGAKRGFRKDPEFLDHIKDLRETDDVLVQPYLPSVATDGEVSLLYFDGVFSHAVRKRPASGDFRVQEHHGGTVEDHTPTAQEMAVAEAALAAAPAPTLYARVDLVEHHGAPVVMELELIEPELFLRRSPAAAAVFAARLRAALG